MRLLGKVALGGGLASAATATWLVAAGVLAGSATLIALDPIAPPAAAGAPALTTFDSCSALKDWYLDEALKDVGPYGWNGGIRHGYGRIAFADQAVELSAGMATKASGAVPQSATGTNTQEATVDEPDIAKTNGTLVARIVNDDTLVLLDVTGPDAVVFGRLPLPRNGYQNELLLAGNRVLVTQQTYTASGDLTTAAKVPGYYGPGRVATRLFDIDISDPTNPRIISRDRYSGRLLSLRQYGETIRLVTATGRPGLDWTYPGKGVSTKEATQQNRALVRSTSVERWMPSVIRDGKREALLTCSDVLHPATYSGDETLAVTTFPAGNTGARSATALTAGGGIVYSSSDRLYVATSDYGGFYSEFTDARVRPHDQTTDVHAFDLTGAQVRYVGSGEVPGNLRDRWSLDEYNGHLRVAWSRANNKGINRNGITILSERDGALEPNATIEDLGVNEDLQAVRWFDDLAVLVTFRQIDPLYTIDLTDPDHPVVLGVLKIPGFSGYLHPLGNDLLLGLGVNGNARGRTSGAQAAVFDISNLRKPAQISQATFGPNTYLTALDDPRAFTWITDGIGATPVSDWSEGKSQMMKLSVTPAGKLTATSLGDLAGDWNFRTLPLADGRVAILDRHRVRLLSLTD